MTESAAVPEQLPLQLKLDEGATLESYYPGRNRGVVAHIRAAVEHPAWIFLWGGAGAGKTHLLNAASHLAGAAGYASCLLPLSRHGEIAPELLENLHGLQLVCVDDLHAIAADRPWEEALFHLLNRLRREHASVIVSADCRPANLHLSLPDLGSRLGWGTVLKVRGLTDDDKIRALQLRARTRGFELPEESAIYLMRRVARDTRTLMRLLEQLDTASLQAKRKLTVPFLREAIGKLR